MATPQPRQAAPQAQTTGLAQTPKDNLISRYKLQDRVVSSSFSLQDDDASSKANWEATSEKREASLQERKAKMILAARQYVSTFAIEFCLINALSPGDYSHSKLRKKGQARHQVLRHTKHPISMICTCSKDLTSVLIPSVPNFSLYSPCLSHTSHLSSNI